MSEELLDRLVDWDLAAATARRLARPGPQVSASEATDVVREVRDAAVAARPHVARITGLQTADAEPVVLVVDRPRWVEANLQTLRAMLLPVVDKLASRRHLNSTNVVAALGGKVTGAEAGGLLAFLSSKVLGQYDLAPGGTPRLLLVAPNLVHVEREMGVDPHDFRLWVCLHEETHRVQFTAVPWLREHLLAQATSLAGDLAPDPAQLITTLEDAARRLPEVLRGEGGSLIDLFASPEQRERLRGVAAVMSLLEGHADVVMDEVGPEVVPSVATIRARFTARRAGVDPFDRMIRRLLGLEDKMRQYRDGAAFVRGVVAEVGMDGFNAVWTSPETLPTPQEIADPRAWVRRVHP
ncbi:zinc-dependent metalloprotease [Angustibacter sp. Root456]|uniref:zinc-dependent metalloprotease n=1 Tax=Angustibacter sp. Root456 TaxID=1736539 RepID=UPI0006FC1D17|nr:zinc-dependent metalloprotease [Angustibacter sp. Root456]KQX66261.1 coenzyme F420 biosynthesis protein [Angustibacter sp. Root456]